MKIRLIKTNKRKRRKRKTLFLDSGTDSDAAILSEVLRSAKSSGWVRDLHVPIPSLLACHQFPAEKKIFCSFLLLCATIFYFLKVSLLQFFKTEIPLIDSFRNLDHDTNHKKVYITKTYFIKPKSESSNRFEHTRGHLQDNTIKLSTMVLNSDFVAGSKFPGIHSVSKLNMQL